jgi:hypothetical protein
MKRVPKRLPSVYGIGWFASYRLVARTPKPTATISIPMRFSGRRVQPIRPATTNDRLTNSASEIV